MTIHRSLAVQGKMLRNRSVLTRLERIQKLAKDGRWSESNSIYGLPKVRTIVRVTKKKKKGPEKEEGKEGAVAAAPIAQTPAAKPAAKAATKK